MLRPQIPDPFGLVKRKNRGVTSWARFEAEVPELARFGHARLLLPPAYLATMRSAGRPRVHPVTPIIGGGHLFLFMEPTSPKVADLRERRVYALHNGVPDINGTGGEFLVSGRATLVIDPAQRSVATSAASYEPADRYVLFELDITEARSTGYGDVPIPLPRTWLDPET